jgi:hypothetical protein
MHAHKWKRHARETETTVKEIRRKASKIAPAYNKGALQYLPDEKDRWGIAMRAQENSTIAESSSSLGVLTLVETSGHEKDGTQNQHGNHASGQKTASVTSHEIHHVVSCKRLIVGPNELRAVLVPTALWVRGT